MDIGFNFRASSGYVTDGTNETYSLGEAYPVTRGGVTFGWSSSQTGNARNRSSAVDRRLAGLVFGIVVGTYFRVDLPQSGQYDIHLAMGDQAFANYIDCDLADTSTNLVQYRNGGSQVTAANFMDASGVIRTAANWPSAEVKTTQTFSTTQLRIVVASPTGVASVIAHLRIVSAAAYVLTAACGTLTLSGQSATLRPARRIACSAGTIVSTGQSVALRRACTLSLVTGSFSAIGQPASLLASRKLICSAGDFSVIGQASSLLRAFRLTVDAGAFILSGQTASLIATRSLVVSPVSLNLSGQSVNLLAGRKVIVSNVLFELIGNHAELNYEAGGVTPVSQGHINRQAASFCGPRLQSHAVSGFRRSSITTIGMRAMA